MAQEGITARDTLSTLQDWIEHGISLPLTSTPSALRYANTSTVDEYHDQVTARLHEYSEFGAVTDVDDTNPTYIQPLHVITKNNHKPRIVIDLSRNLNEHIQRFPFHYTSVEDAAEIATPNCWFGKIDLSNCFLSFPMHQTAWKHLTFSFAGRLQQFVRLPFGLSSAPYQCTQFLSVPAWSMSQAGMKFVRYLDDFLFVADSVPQLLAVITAAIQIFEDFGLVINPNKIDGPSQRITFLGVVIDSTTQTLACTTERIDELTSLLQQHQSQRDIRVRAAQSLVGKLSFAAKVLPGARPFMRRMHDLIRDRAAPSRFALMRLDKGWKADANFWLRHFQHWNGKQRWRSSPTRPLVIATDASIVGFGFHVEQIPDSISTSHWPRHLLVGSGFAGRYNIHHKHLHNTHTKIAWGEMFAVLAAIVTYGPLARDQSLLFLVDNQTDVHILNRQATRSERLASLLRRIYAETSALNINIRAKHRRGEDNIVADFLSRYQGDDMTDQWQRSYPHIAHRLSSVSIVYSEQFHPNSERPSATSFDRAN